MTNPDYFLQCPRNIISNRYGLIYTTVRFSFKFSQSREYMYRLIHHEVEVSTGFTHRGREARGCVNRIETELSDVTNLYHGLRGPDNVSTA